MDERKRYEQGIKVRREVLGDAHVDRSLQNRDAFNEEFQEIAWVKPEQLREYDLNVATRQTFIDKGLL